MANRNRNWSQEESSLLVSLVNDDLQGKNILHGKFSNSVTNIAKGLKWREITEQINLINGKADRTTGMAKKKYQNLSGDARKKERKRKSYMKGTGGGPRKVMKFTEEEAMILSNTASEQVSGISGGIETDHDPSHLLSGSVIDQIPGSSCSQDLFMSMSPDPDISYEIYSQVETVEEIVQYEETRSQARDHEDMSAVTHTKKRLQSTTVVQSPTPAPQPNSSTATEPAQPISGKRTISKCEREREFAEIRKWNQMQLKLLNSISDQMRTLVDLKKAKYLAKGYITIVDNSDA